MSITEQPRTTGRPYWQTRPCPAWCAYSHESDTCIHDALHLSGQTIEIVLSTEPGRSLGTPHESFREPSIEAYLAQHELERDPRVRMNVDTETVRDEVHLSIAEATRLRDALSLLITTAESAEPR